MHQSPSDTSVDTSHALPRRLSSTSLNSTSVEFDSPHEATSARCGCRREIRPSCRREPLPHAWGCPERSNFVDKLSEHGLSVNKEAFVRALCGAAASLHRKKHHCDVCWPTRDIHPSKDLRHDPEARAVKLILKDESRLVRIHWK